MKTFSTRMSEVDHTWHVIDATDQPLGRLATQVAVLLRGKHKPIYQPNLPVGDFVVVINAERVRVTGNKAEAKTYYRHSQYPGGLKQVQFRHMMEKHPTRAVEKAVKGMLPHNALGRKLFTRLKVYAGAEHPHAAQLAAGPQPSVGRRRAPVKPTPAAQRSAPVATRTPTPAPAPVEGPATPVTPQVEAASSELTTEETNTEST
jgi:large subunit ribosomal protein L13